MTLATQNSNDNLFLYWTMEWSNEYSVIF
jgi:hypothetical protein